MARPVTAPHGTPAAVKRHQRNRESLAKATTVCPACTAELARLNAEKYAKRRSGSVTG